MNTPSEFFKCLADETRLTAVMLILHEQELCVCELTEAMSESQPKISRHLAQLKSMSVLNTERQSQWIYYRINEDLPQWAKDVLKTTLAEEINTIQPCLDRLQRMGSRPERQSKFC